MTKIALALGGNIGNTANRFHRAKQFLAQNGLKNIKMSSIFTSPAVACVAGTPDFSNAAITGNWNDTPYNLLDLTQKLEVESGRPTIHRSDMSRTLDIDIILFGQEIISTERLTIPHPRATVRNFVLIPLSEIAPNWIFPTTGLTVKAYLQNPNRLCRN